MPQLVIVAAINARPGSGPQLETVLRSLVAPSRLEAGCLRYDLHRVADNAEAFVFLETWTGREAHQAHMATAHFQEARASQQDLVASREVKFLEQI